MNPAWCALCNPELCTIWCIIARHLTNSITWQKRTGEKSSNKTLLYWQSVDVDKNVSLVRQYACLKCSVHWVFVQPTTYIEWLSKLTSTIRTITNNQCIVVTQHCGSASIMSPHGPLTTSYMECMTTPPSCPTVRRVSWNIWEHKNLTSVIIFN